MKVRAAKKLRKLSQAEFQRVLREVRADINDLHLNERVFGGVVENLRRYPSLGHQFPAFFGAFYSAMRTDLIIRLGRIYDPEGTGHDSCTLMRCLSTLLHSPEFFTHAAISTRLREDYRKANPNYFELHRLDEERIRRDIELVERSRTRLINLRHKLYAHKDLETVLSGSRTELLSTHEEVRALIKLAHEVLNRCSELWNASIWSDKVMASDDYEWLFTSLRRGIKVKDIADNRMWERLRKRGHKPVTRTMQEGI